MSVLQRDSQLLGSIAQRRHRLLSVRPLVHCCRVTKESGLGVCRSGRLQESSRASFSSTAGIPGIADLPRCMASR